MTRKLVIAIAGFFLMMGLSCLSAMAQNVKEPSTGVSFLSKGGNYGHTFEVTHLGVRSKLGFKVYAAAAYYETGKYDKAADAKSQMLKDGPAKLIIMHFVRDVEAAKIREQYEESLRKNTSGYDSLKSVVDPFLNSLVDMKSGDRMELCWGPGGAVTLAVKGQVKNRFTNKSLATGLWSIWFGNSPILTWKAQ